VGDGLQTRLYKPDFGWIELPVFGEDGFPIHYRGVVSEAPGLCFLGLPFQYTITSAFIGGVVKDARYIADHLTGRAGKQKPAGEAAAKASRTRAKEGA
jgi:putative flavoprotein involved in K+ transport